MVAIARIERKKKSNLTLLKQGTKSPIPLSNSHCSNQFNKTAVDEENPIADNEENPQRDNV
jgi:hypothetical protein